MDLKENMVLNKVDIETPVDDIIAYYQPIVFLENTLIVGYEVLARKVVNESILTPIDWLPQLLLENRGSERLTQHILSLVLDKMSQISDEKYLSVNFEIEDVDNVNLHSIIHEFQEQQLAHRLVIEITERGHFFKSSKAAVDKLKKFNSRIALDDFGSGASRFLSVIDFQPDVIKLDKTVTDRIGESEVQNTIKSLSEWCENKGIKILAEGIENRAQVQDCISAGVIYGQGYYFGKPEEL